MAQNDYQGSSSIRASLEIKDSAEKRETAMSSFTAGL